MDASRLGWTYAVTVGITLVVGVVSLGSAAILPRLLIAAVGVLGLTAVVLLAGRGPRPRAAWAAPLFVHAHVLWLGLGLWSRLAPDAFDQCRRTGFLPHAVEVAYLDYLTASRFALVLLALLVGAALVYWPRTRLAGLWTLGGVAAFLPLHWVGLFLGGCPEI